MKHSFLFVYFIDVVDILLMFIDIGRGMWGWELFGYFLDMKI